MPSSFFLFYKFPIFDIFLPSGFCFLKHSWITGLQGKGKGTSLTPHYHFQLLHRHLDISQAITAENSPQQAAQLELRTFGFQAKVTNH